MLSENVYNKLKVITYTLLIFLISITLLKLAESIIKPLFIAILLAFLVSPILSFLRKLKFPNIFSIVLVFIILLTFSYLVFRFVYYSVYIISNEFPSYQKKLMGILFDLMEKYNVSDEFIKSNINISGTIYSMITSFSSSFISFFSNLFLIFLFLFFLLSEMEIFGIKLKKALKDKFSLKFFNGIRTINIQIGKYLGIKILISFLTGLFVYIGLSIFNQNFALVWGVLAFVFNFIPNIGSFVIVLFITLAALVEFYPSVNMALAVLIYNTLIQMIFGNLLEPKLQGTRLDISPFFLICSLFFWGWLWGAVGLLIAYPITMIIKVIIDNVDYLSSLSVFLGGGLREDEKSNANR